MSATLASAATALETAAGATTSTNPNEPGYWSRMAAASETLAGASTSANAVTSGYMLRTALALESIAGTSGAEENTNYSGYLKRIVDALEVQSGAVETGSLEHRLLLGAQNATFVEGPTDLLDSAPMLTQGGGSAVIASGANDAVAFTGGSAGAACNATWTIEETVSGASYRIEYTAADQALGCAPRFQLGGGSVITGSGATGAQSVTVVAGGTGTDLVVTFSPNSAGRNLSISGITLFRMLVTLTVFGTVEENAIIGTVVGDIQNVTAGSVLTLTDDAGGLFAIDAGNLVTAGALDFETAVSHDIEITETLASAYGSPKATPMSITVTDQPTLAVLSLVNDTVVFGAGLGEYNSQVLGFDATSELTLTDNGGGPFVITGAPGAWSVENNAEITDPVSTVYNIEITETLVGAENSPNATPLTITVTAP